MDVTPVPLELQLMVTMRVIWGGLFASMSMYFDILLLLDFYTLLYFHVVLCNSIVSYINRVFTTFTRVIPFIVGKYTFCHFVSSYFVSFLHFLRD